MNDPIIINNVEVSDLVFVKSLVDSGWPAY